MNLEAGFMQALHENPSDETTWLALSDWLEDNDQPQRAELLRLQRSLRHMDEGPERIKGETRLHQLLLARVHPLVPVLVNSLGIQLALLWPGSFWIGSPESEEGRYPDESPRKRIELTRPFYLGVYPITQEEYSRLMNHNPSRFALGGDNAEDVAGLNTQRFPVETVTWNDAVAFCHRLNELPQEKAAGRFYRLPTEIEWEYACRGGSNLFPFPWGNEASSDLINFRDVTKSTHIGHTSAVGSYLPNGFGFFDMLGNTWEWCGDWYANDAYARLQPRDPTTPEIGERRNARGGTYSLTVRRVRSADRSSFDVGYRDSDMGFRVLCERRG